MKRDNRYYLIINILGIICLAIGAGVLVYTTRFIFSQDIWFDELFTVELSAKPIKELIALASKDVHPPLYYILVRGVYLLCHFLFSDMTVITAAKLTSILPFYLIIVYAITYIRKRFGLISAGLFVLFIEMMPNMSAYLVEARMYSMSVFVLIAMFIHGMEAVRGVEFDFCINDDISYEDACSHIWCFWIKGKRKKCIQGTFKMYANLFVAGLYAICAMYLHYYAFIGAAAIAFSMLCYIVVNFYKDSRKVKNYIAAGDTSIHRLTIRPDVSSIIAVIVMCLVAYVPWEGVVLSQTGVVSASYWIQPLTFKSIFGCLKFIFKPEFESGAVNYLVAILLIVSIALLYIRYFYVRKKHKNDLVEELMDNNSLQSDAFFVMSTIITLVLIVFAGFVLSILIRPVFVYRYMIPVLGVFWMGVAIVIGDVLTEFNKYISALIALLAIVLSLTMVRDYRMFMWEEDKKQDGMATTMEAFQMIGENHPDSLIVCNFNQVQAVLWHYLDNESVLWGETDELLVGEICGRSPMVMFDDADILIKLLSDREDDEFLFVGSGNAREDIISLWENEGMQVEEVADSCLLERYYFNVYNVSWR